MTPEERFCHCGCGEPLDGAPTRRFVDDAHRKRAARARASSPDTNPDTGLSDPDTDPDGAFGPPAAPEMHPGRARAGLEEWLERIGELPAALVAHGRILADELDADPDNSPLHGRYATALAALVEAAEALDARVAEERAELVAEIRHAGDVESYRAAKYREAEAAGDEVGMRRWRGPLVPQACAYGDHEWRPWPSGRVACVHCNATDEDASDPKSLGGGR